MKRLSNSRSRSRSSSKTRPTRLTDHSYEPKDDEVTTQKLKFASLYEDDDDEAIEVKEEAGGLRQKHKKIWKISSIKNGVNNQKQQHQQQEKFVCNKCGKGFQSLKAKCGHMACHSEKEKTTITNLVANQKLAIVDSHSDTESGPRRPTRRSRRTQYKKHNSVSKVTSKAKVNIYKNYSSEDSGVEHEQEEVAISLMMLSRDSSNWGGLNSVGDSSDNNSVVLETKSISPKLVQKDGLSNVCKVDEALKKCVMSLDDFESLKVRGFRKCKFDEGSKTDPHLSLKKLKRVFDEGLVRNGEGWNQSKRPKMDLCLTKRSLNQPNSKHKNFAVASPYESGEESFETDASPCIGKGALEQHLSNVGDQWKKKNRHEVSANFKRNGNQLHEFIDLNLPAPMEDDEA